MFSWIKKSFSRRGASGTSPVDSGPLIIPRDEHGVSRANISQNALKVLYRLDDAGYEAYLVGGGVRDLLLGREPKDFDIATDATPDEVRKLFRNCRLIGRRFRLAHVHFGRDIIEVATFRAAHDGAGNSNEAVSDEGMLLRDNVYGTLEDDAWRRDFSINALYYNIRDFSVVDYTGGLEAIEAGQLRVIGDPHQRFREDPVRMLRAIRFAAKLGFRIEEACESAIHELGYLLEGVAPARLFDEMLKMFQGGFAVESYELLRHYNVFGQLFPETELWLSQEENHFPHTLLIHALENTDRRVNQGKPVTPAFLFAALLWEPVRHEARLLMEAKMPKVQAMQVAGDDIIGRQVKRVAVPRRFSLQSREIWEMQERLLQRHPKRITWLYEHPRFRAAYDFLLLRAQSGEDVKEAGEWWTRYQEVAEQDRQKLINEMRPTHKPRTRRRSRPRKRKPAGTQE